MSRIGQATAAVPSCSALRVVYSVPVPKPTTNPYISQLAESLEAIGVNGTWFSWRTALFGTYDVFHMHWPEVKLRSGSLPRRAVCHVLFLLLLLRIRFGRPVLVRTLHERKPHEPGVVVERALLRLCDRWTGAWITLIPEEAPSNAPVTVIPHGDYTNWFSSYRVPSSEPGRVLYFGLIRPYKNVLGLMDAFGRSDMSTATLHVVGSSPDADLAAQVSRLAAADDRIDVHLDYVDDEFLAREIGESELVVLPYREMRNSGALLLALSLGRRALVPANGLTTALADEVGAGWVQLYEPPLRPAHIEDALAAPPPQGAPDLSGRTWAESAERHLRAYRSALAGHATDGIG